MKRILIELDDRCARDLERLAPAKKRLRAEFIRLALRRAIDLALDRDTEAAYRKHPVAGEVLDQDLASWDSENKLARRPTSSRRRALGAARAPGTRRHETVRDLVGKPADPVGRRPVLLLSRTSAFAYLNRVLVAEVTTTVRGIPRKFPSVVARAPESVCREPGPSA